VDSLREFLKVATKHPFTAVGLIVLWIVVTIGWEVLHKRITDWINPPPFSDLDGLYAGKMEQNNFHLCLKVYGTHVLGSMSWDGDKDDASYVDYEGDIDIEHNQVNLRYARNRNAVDPDHGIAVVSPAINGEYGGYWESTAGNPNREIWSIIKKYGQSCELIKWSGVNSQ
jgi:hypothetical protein